MASLERKNLGTPDEREVYERGYSNEVHLGETVVSHEFYEPGWRWSEHVKPIVGTPSCRFHHTGVVLRGRMHVRLDDGTEAEYGPLDVMDVPPGHDGWIVGDEPTEVISWVGAHRWASSAVGERILSTILFTDIVDSTAHASRLGDRDWGLLLEEHNVIARRVLDRFRGREVATTGDGVLALFDGAERAVHAAVALTPALASIDVEVRAGLHTGEIEVVPGSLRGKAVHIAARVMALAGPGEVLVSGTTRSLIEAADVAFVDRGVQALKGIDVPVQIYAVGTSS
jgi:class 3 adenylate cyclase